MALKICINLILKLLMISLITWSMPGHTSNDFISVIRPDGQHFKRALQGLADDLDGELIVEDNIMSTSSGVEYIKQIMQRRPKLVVLMSNHVINAYTAYQKQAKPDEIMPPALLLIALKIDRHVETMKNATGIVYEVPLATSLIYVRSLTQQPLNKIGIIYRSWMRPDIERHRQFLAPEGVEIVSVELPNESSRYISLIKKALKKFRSNGVDALWIENDNALLKSQLLRKAWLPSVKRFRKPVIVGVDSLLAKKMNFGDFGALPDYYVMGVQCSNMILNIQQNNWQLFDEDIEQPLAIKKHINLYNLKRKKIAIHANRLQEVDVILR